MKKSLLTFLGTLLALSSPLLAQKPPVAPVDPFGAAPEAPVAEAPAAEAPAAEAPAAEAPAADAPAAPAGELSTDKQKGSYAFGMNVGRNLGPIAKQLDLEVFIRALRDSVEGKEPLMDDVEGRKAFMAFQSGAMEAAQAANLETGKAYLTKNLEDKEVVQLASGLQYKVIKKGEGDPPKPTDIAKVHYTGTTADGFKFDSSRDRGQPAEFPVNGVIAGWTEALQLMSPGSRYMLYIPSDLAYGAEGKPPRIPPHSVLVFDVELLEVSAPQKPGVNPFK